VRCSSQKWGEEKRKHPDTRKEKKGEDKAERLDTGGLGKKKAASSNGQKVRGESKLVFPGPASWMGEKKKKGRTEQKEREFDDKEEERKKCFYAELGGRWKKFRVPPGQGKGREQRRLSPPQCSNKGGGGGRA